MPLTKIASQAAVFICFAFWKYRLKTFWFLTHSFLRPSSEPSRQKQLTLQFTNQNKTKENKFIIRISFHPIYQFTHFRNYFDVLVLLLVHTYACIWTRFRCTDRKQKKNNHKTEPQTVCVGYASISIRHPHRKRKIIKFENTFQVLSLLLLMLLFSKFKQICN